MNRATRIIVSILGVLLAMSGMIHGYFEILQGNAPTDGLILDSVGAFTVIPNFLITGIVAIIVSLSIIIWTVGFIHRKNGPHVFILLCILLFLVGGGIAQIVFFALVWAVSTRINKPLNGWRQVLPDRLRKLLAKLWLWFFIVWMLFFAIGVEIWLVGYVPGVNDATQKLYICWAFLAVGLGVLLVDIVAGFAYDIERQVNSHQIASFL